MDRLPLTSRKLVQVLLADARIDEQQAPKEGLNEVEMIQIPPTRYSSTTENGLQVRSSCTKQSASRHRIV